MEKGASEIVKLTKNFNSKHCIGVGAYGIVYKALLSTGQVVEVKKFQENDRRASLEAFTGEINVLTTTRHRNLITIFVSKNGGILFSTLVSKQLQSSSLSSSEICYTNFSLYFPTSSQDKNLSMLTRYQKLNMHCFVLSVSCTHIT